MTRPSKAPDFSLAFWKPVSVDQFMIELHRIELEDEMQHLINGIWEFRTGQWATVFFQDSKDGPLPRVMILHHENEEKTKLLYFIHT